MAAVVFSGLTELMQALLHLPDHLTDRATSIVEAAATNAMAEMAANYPTHTGNLRRGLKKDVSPGGRYGVGIVVKNTAKHAWIFENGTQVRHTAIGANRGAMPPGHVFIPAAMRHRATMYRQLSAMLVEEGFLVTGLAA